MANPSIPTAIEGTFDANPHYAVSSTENSILASPNSGYADEVDYVRPELIDMKLRYQEVSDCVAGEKAVKAQGVRYLPNPDPVSSPSMMESVRYANYKMRAVFFNVTKKTRNGLLGQVFLRDPTFKLPTACRQLEKNCDGSGVSLKQLAKAAVSHNLDFGRCGIFVDFPQTDRQVSRADLLSGTVQPTLNLYHPADIRNWRTITVNGKTLLSLVVLAEWYAKSDNGFKAERAIQFRVLRLEPGAPTKNGHQYTQQIYREGNTLDKIVPRDGKGKLIEEIPFTFIGAETNNSDIDEPPLHDLASVNLAHYRNSADYEESVFLVGQPTPWASGLTEHWVKEVLGGELQIGSRAVIPLPENGACGLLQAEPNQLAKEAMDGKERQMVALGAKLVEQKQVQRTATEANQDEASETSVLSTIASNVSAAIKFALEWAAIFTGEVTQDGDARSKAVDYKLNTKYDLTKLDATMLSAVIKAWQSEALTDEEMRDTMTRAGYASKPIEEWQQERENKMAAAVDQLAAETAATSGVPTNE